MKIDVVTGRVNEARWLASPNYDDRPDPDDISALIIHAISLPPDCFGGGYVDSLFTNCLATDTHPYFEEIAHLKVSAHFFINREGCLTQFVSTKQRAWHAGISNLNGREWVNDFSIGVELEGCDTEAFTDLQYRQLAKLTRSLLDAHPCITKDRIAGHSDIAPGRKTDPGPHFDWSRFYQSVFD